MEWGLNIRSTGGYYVRYYYHDYHFITTTTTTTTTIIIIIIIIITIMITIIMKLRGSQGTGVVRNSWFDRVLLSALYMFKP